MSSGRRPYVALALAVACLLACSDDRSSGSNGVPAAPAPPSPSAPASSPAAPAGPGPSWSARASLPFAQQETAVVTLDGKLYVLGGFDSARAVLAVVHVYDPKANAWSTAAPLPRPLHHVNATVVGDRLWITGALESMAFTATGDVLMFDPKLDVWTAKAPMPAGSERGSAMVGAIGKTVYVAGGLRGGAAVSDFASYDTELGVWTTLPVLPLARDHGAGAIAGDVFFAVGGRSSSIGAHTARVDAFDIAKGAWSDRAPMPTSRAGFALAVAKGRLVVMGGEGDPRRDSAVFPEVEAYDPSSNTWTPLPAMTTPRHGMGAASVDDVVFAPGGGTRQAFAATEVVEALTF